MSTAPQAFCVAKSKTVDVRPVSTLVLFQNKRQRVLNCLVANVKISGVANRQGSPGVWGAAPRSLGALQQKKHRAKLDG